MSVLKRIPIGIKIAGGAGLIVLLLLALGWETTTSLNIANDNFVRYRTLALESNALGRIRDGVLEIHLNARTFLQGGRSEEIRELHERVSALNTLVANTKKLLAGSGSNATLDVIEKLVGEYREAFVTITEQHENAAKVVTHMKQLAPRLEASLAEIMTTAHASGTAETVWLASEAQRPLIPASLKGVALGWQPRIGGKRMYDP